MLHQVNFHNPFNGASVDVKKFSSQIELNIHANMCVYSKTKYSNSKVFLLKKQSFPMVTYGFFLRIRLEVRALCDFVGPLEIMGMHNCAEKYRFFTAICFGH